MATNPQIPPQRNFRRDDQMHVVSTRKRNSWWPPVLIIGFLAVIGALIWWLSTSPNRNAPSNSVAAQAAGGNVELANLSATTPTTTGEFDVQGMLVNHGTNPITGVRVDATFRNIKGESLETVPADVLPASAVRQLPNGLPEGSATGTAIPSQTHGFVKPGGGEGNLTKQPANPQNPQTGPGFAKNPIAPGQSVPVVIRFTHVPEGTVGGVPQLHITSVTTAQGSNAGR